jgi:hypothetical protein
MPTTARAIIFRSGGVVLQSLLRLPYPPLRQASIRSPDEPIPGGRNLLGERADRPLAPLAISQSTSAKHPSPLPQANLTVIPSFAAHYRNHPQMMPIFLINFF